jgi:FixJ family two-component response regulator
MSDTASPVLPAPAKVRPKVLVVDDELGPRESISYLLQEEFEVVAVDRVDHGLEQIKQGNFACVIMDIRMPQKNGIQGLEAMRKIDPEVSIIMMTGYGALATAQAAISLGANEYLKKPFDVDVLQQAVRRHVAEGIERKKRTGMLSQLESMYESVMTEQKKQQLSSGFSQAAAAMVHDICNPLVVSIGYTNMLLDEVRQLPAPANAFCNTPRPSRSAPRSACTWPSPGARPPATPTKWTRWTFTKRRLRPRACCFSAPTASRSPAAAAASSTASASNWSACSKT